MTKKAQGLSLNTIIIAALVIIVLLVLIGIFNGYFGKWVPQFLGTTAQKCEGDLHAVDEGTGCAKDERQLFGNFGDTLKTGQVCCKKALCGEKVGTSCSVSCTTFDGTFDSGERRPDNPALGCTANRYHCCKA